MLNKELKRISDYLTEKDAEFDEMMQTPDGTLEVHICWGDWKHAHLYMEHLMRELGYHKSHEQVTEEDGSDCYSSIHYYVKMEEK